MFKECLRGLMLFVVLTVIAGFVYPLAMTAFAQALFPVQANGSLIIKDGVVKGSRLIGQRFASDGYFQGRPSSAGDSGYDAQSSSGSNMGPTNKLFIDEVKARVDSVRSRDALPIGASVPSDLVLASGSGLDPHISPEAALVQVSRIARVRGLSQERVRALVNKHSRTAIAGFIGEPRVNVLELNMELDALR